MSSDRPAEMPPEKPAHRHISFSRDDTGHYTVTSATGATLTIGGAADFTPVELLLAGLAGCTATDGRRPPHRAPRRAVPESFVVAVDAEKVADDRGNHLDDITVTFRIAYPECAGGDAARAILPDIVKKSHDRLCTVSRTIMLGTDITTVID